MCIRDRVYTVLKDIFIFQVCFSDESMFAISEESSQYVRRSADEEFSPQCIAQTVKYPTQVKVWSVMSAQGTRRLYIVVSYTHLNASYLNMFIG